MWLVLAAFVGTSLAGGVTRDTGGSSSSDEKKDDGKSSSSSKKGKKKKIWGWNYQPYVMPGGGVTVNASETSVVGGVDAGIEYWRKNWVGNLYAGASYTTGSGLNGYDVHIGDQMGAREKYWGLTGGLEGVFNGYTYQNGEPAMAPAAGLFVPIEAVAGPKQYYVYGGFAPGFYTDRSRNARVFGVFHELEWHAGLGLKLKWATGKIGVSQVTTVVGSVLTPTITLSVTGLDIN